MGEPEASEPQEAADEPAVVSAPVAAAAEGVGDQPTIEGGNPKCFFTTFKSGLDSPPFECTQDMKSARSCLNGKIY